MIKRLQSGEYSLIETFEHTKILILDEKIRYAWIDAGKIGDILITTKKKFYPENIISSGNYRLYDVDKEPDLTDLEHLELFVGEGKWQGYLLPTGLPEGKLRRKIISTDEIITKTTH